MKPSWCRRAALTTGARSRLPIAALRFLRQAALWLSLFTACGYRALSSSASGERLCVLAAPSKVPDSGAIQGALAGAREELARHSGLGESGVYPCLVLELLRVDEAPAGIVVTRVEGTDQPRARGSGAAIVGRAWVQQGPEAPLSRDTGDVRRVARLQASTGPLEGARHDQGLEQAGQELGRALARRVLGLPTPGDELP